MQISKYDHLSVSITDDRQADPPSQINKLINNNTHKNKNIFLQ